MENTIHIVGFGSQGSAWAECLRSSGWDVQVYLSQKGGSFQKALASGFQAELLPSLSKKMAIPKPHPHWIALLCPDSCVAPLYNEWIAPTPTEIRLILAHGYAIYADELHMKKPQHQLTLLAPKAIGPKLQENFSSSFPDPHSLVAGIASTPCDLPDLHQIARALGFSVPNLVTTTFEQEAIGDLISEQGLLCGGVFNLLEWTLEAMTKAGIPEALIKEECLSELELIAGLIRKKGPGQAFQAISQAAQSGTIAMKQNFESAGLKAKFIEQMKWIENREFVNFFRSANWKPEAERLTTQLLNWEKKLS